MNKKVELKVTMKSGKTFSTTVETEKGQYWEDLDTNDCKFVFFPNLILPKHLIEAMELIDPAHEELKTLSEKV